MVRQEKGGRKASKVCLVFPPHQHGRLARASEVQPQPPLGLLTIASYLSEALPDIACEVIDGKALGSEEKVFDEMDGDIVGFSVWYSNYTPALRLAERYREENPHVVIIFGGPHATALGNRILTNNEYIDYVVLGEGELPLLRLAEGTDPADIPGVLTRLAVGGYSPKRAWFDSNLATHPKFDLKNLVPAYSSRPSRGGAAMSAFPLAGVRGCLRTKRCEYCSIPFVGVRTMSPSTYWAQVKFLNEQYGIDYFFETGDIFPPQFLQELEKCEDYPDVGFRVYTYPGIMSPSNRSKLGNVGVDTVFMGVESSLVWNRTMKRRYARAYSKLALLGEMRQFGMEQINVIPGFVLGLPGETEDSLRDTSRLIRDISSLDNVSEITVSVVLPLPGAELFQRCVGDRNVSARYARECGGDLGTGDRIDYYLLSRIMIDAWCDVEHRRISEEIERYRLEIGAELASWLE